MSRKLQGTRPLFAGVGPAGLKAPWYQKHCLSTSQGALSLACVPERVPATSLLLYLHSGTPTPGSWLVFCWVDIGFDARLSAGWCVAFCSVSESGMTAVCLSLDTLVAHLPLLLFSCQWGFCTGAHTQPRAVLCAVPASCSLCCLARQPAVAGGAAEPILLHVNGSLAVHLLQHETTARNSHSRICGAALGTFPTHECTAASTLQHPPPVAVCTASALLDV